MHTPPAAHSRFESIGVRLPERRVSSEEVISNCRHGPRIDLELLAGIRERRVCAPGEN